MESFDFRIVRGDGREDVVGVKECRGWKFNVKGDVDCGIGYYCR